MSASARAALKQRKQTYVASLSVRAAELRRCLCDDDLDTARRILHRLAGSGGLYELNDVSAGATTLLAALSNGSTLAELAPALNEYTDRLDRAAGSQTG